MTIPRTVRTSVSPDTLAKVTRLFNGTVGDMLAELFQNARRAGASRIAVTTARAGGGRLRLTVADDGHGIADPTTLLGLGHSGWDGETLRAEDPAGMGLFALAGRPVRVATQGAAGAWTLDIPAAAWASGAELPVEAGHNPAEPGANVSVEVPGEWERELRTEVERAARYHPLPVTLDGAEMPRHDFLAEAARIETWRGLRLGVVEEQGWSRDPRINFFGLTVPCPLPQVAERRGPAWSVRVDVVDCPELQLVLPARKEVVATPFLDELFETCERAIYRHIAARGQHRLPASSWRRAALLGIVLPEAAAELDLWTPVTNDGEPDLRFRAGHGDGATPLLPAEPLVIDDAGPDLEQSLARAIAVAAPELRERLVNPCQDYEGYGWYDALPRVTDVVGALVRGEVSWTTQDEATPPASGVVDRVVITLTLTDGESTVRHSLETDLLLVANDDAWADPDEQGVFVVPGPRLGPGDVAEAVVSAFFMSSDDRDAESWETQADRFKRDALDLSRRLLLGDEAADLARIRDVIRERIAWLVPQGRELRVRLDAKSLEVSLTPPAESSTAGAG